MFIGSRTFDWLTRLQEIVDVEGVVRDHVLRERDDESDLQWEGVIEECKRELISTCIEVATMAGWRPGRPHVRMRPSSSVPGVTRPAAMRAGRGGRHLYSSDEDADETPAEGQPSSTAAPGDPWFPPAPTPPPPPPTFGTMCGAGTWTRTPRVPRYQMLQNRRYGAK